MFRLCFENPDDPGISAPTRLASCQKQTRYQNEIRPRDLGSSRLWLSTTGPAVAVVSALVPEAAFRACQSLVSSVDQADRTEHGSDQQASESYFQSTGPSLIEPSALS